MEPSEVRSGKKKEKRGGNPQFRILIICVFIVIEIIILFLHISGTLDTIQYIILLVITIVLFISSLSLILSSKKLNQSNLQESARARDEREKERLRLLRVKMDNFYGPLFRNLPKFHVGDRERTKRDFIDPFMRKYLIRKKYNTMASERLRELLDRYFRFTEANIRSEYGKPNDKWKALLDEIRETIKVDFEKLKEEINTRALTLLQSK